MRTIAPVLLSAALLLVWADPARAQPSSPRPAPTLEGQAGLAAFVDDAAVRHEVVGASARYYLSRRVAIGPELLYLVGPGSDRDLIATGNITFDLRAPARRGAVPYLVAGAGLFQHSDAFNGVTFTSREGAWTGGAGIRAWVSDRAYVAGEYRVGWELHHRASIHVGVGLGPR
jgi:hypothetical protein